MHVPMGSAAAGSGKSSSYTVSFGRIARTLIYKDEQGVLVFTFDLKPAPGADGKHWMLTLDPRALTEDHSVVAVITEDQRQRIEEAATRTANYAVSQGYSVR
jgi:hypothetical protein